LEAIGLLDSARRTIALRLGRRGLDEQRRKLLEAHLRMLEQSGGPGGVDPTIGVLAALTRAELVADDGAIATLRAAIERFPADRRLPERIEAAVGHWIATDIDPFPSGADPNGEARGRLEPEAHARALIRALESRCETLGPYPHFLPAVAYRVACIAVNRGAEQRKAARLDDARLDDARHTAACFLAFARTLQRRDANEPTYHLIMSLAFEQEEKNAWKVKVKDYAAIEHALRKALGEARTALRLDSRYVDARVAVAGLQDKLFNLTSQRGPSR
jgi:hypothetical protein